MGDAAAAEDIGVLWVYKWMMEPRYTNSSTTVMVDGTFTLMPKS